MKQGRKISKEKMIELAVWAVTIICTLLGLWMLISFFDIITHNIESYRGYGEYLEWNFFTVMTEFAENVKENYYAL